jgi:hypothetical protein
MDSVVSGILKRGSSPNSLNSLNGRNKNLALISSRPRSRDADTGLYKGNMRLAIIVDGDECTVCIARVAASAIDQSYLITPKQTVANNRLSP